MPKDKRKIILAACIFIGIFSCLTMVPYLITVRLFRDVEFGGMGLPADIRMWAPFGIFGVYFFLPFPCAIPLFVSTIFTYLVYPRIARRYLPQLLVNTDREEHGE
jgi:hypothetical protein